MWYVLLKYMFSGRIDFSGKPEVGEFKLGSCCLVPKIMARHATSLNQYL